MRGPELVEGITSLEPKEFSVTLMGWNVEGINKVDGHYPGFLR